MSGKCTRCGQPAAISTRGKPKKFCGGECEKLVRRERMLGNVWARGHKPVNSFAPGHATWNKGLKGLHLSPATEFKKGHRPACTLPLGTLRIWTDKNGKLRAYIKVAMPAKWELRPVLVWKAAGRKIPKGYLLHHKDRDTLNDKLRNLALVTRAEHLRLHRAELEPARKEGLRKRLAAS